jgi:hypothetical protein
MMARAAPKVRAAFHVISGLSPILIKWLETTDDSSAKTMGQKLSEIGPSSEGEIFNIIRKNPPTEA